MYEQCLIMFGADRKPEIGMLVIMSGLDRSCDGQGRGHGRVDARENIGRHTWAVVLKFFAERTYFTKSQMSTKKQLNIIVNNKQRN